MLELRVARIHRAFPRTVWIRDGARHVLARTALVGHCEGEWVLYLTPRDEASFRRGYYLLTVSQILRAAYCSVALSVVVKAYRSM